MRTSTFHQRDENKLSSPIQNVVSATRKENGIIVSKGKVLIDTTFWNYSESFLAPGISLDFNYTNNQKFC